MHSRLLCAFSLGLPLVGALACVPPDANDDEGLDDSGETGAAETTDDEGESGSSSEGETTGDSGESSTDEGEEFPECEPSDGATFSWSYLAKGQSLSEGWDASHVNEDWTCTVASTADGPGLHVTLDCPGDELVELDLDASPTFTLDPPLALGESLELHIHASNCFGCDVGADVGLQLERDGAHLLTHQHNSNLIEAPVELTLIDDLCPAQPVDYCGPSHRRAAELTREGETLELYDDQSGSLGDLEVWAKELWVREPGDQGACEHTAYTMTNLLFVSSGG